MKLHVLPLLTIILLITGMACQHNNTVISGRVEGGGDLTLSLERLDVNRTTVIDSVKTGEDGSFQVKINQEEPALYILKNKGQIINLLLQPGEHALVITSDTAFGKVYSVEGSEESEKIRLLVEHLNQTRFELDSLLALVDSIPDPEDPQMKLIQNAYTQTIIRQKRYTIRFLVENMSSLSSVYALYQKYDNVSLILGDPADLQYYKSVADSLEQVYPENPLTLSLRADIRQKEQQIENSFKLDELLGMADEEVTGLLDLSIPDRDGKQVTLSSLHGQVILVVFWASGNQASLDVLLRLRPIYSKYHDKGFEIYAISLDNNKIQWMQSVDFNEFNWVNVCELTYPNSRAQMFYNVTSIPTSFLINREGDILAKNLFGKTLETWLDNLI